MICSFYMEIIYPNLYIFRDKFLTICYSYIEVQNMAKSFNDIYNEVFSKYGDEINKIQNSTKKKVKIAVIIYCIILLALILLKMYFAIIQCSIFYLVISTIIINLTSRYGNGNKYKTGVINDLVKAVYPSSEYNYIKGIPSSKYNKRAFKDHYDRYSSEDLVVTNNAMNLEFSEVHTEVESEDSDGHTTYTTSFSGIAGLCDLRKNINTNLYITSNRAFAKSNKNNVRVDMPEFEKTFDVFADNKITAMGLLTADVMAELLEMKKNLGCMFEIAVENDKIYFRMHTGNSFEMTIFKDSMGVEQLKKYYDLLVYVDRITKLLDKHIQALEI